MTSEPKAPLELIKRYREGRLIPFIGSGITMSISWKNSKGEDIRGPSWEDLVNQAMKLLGFEDPDLLRFRGTDLQILEYYSSKKGNNNELTNWLVQILAAPDSTLQESKLHTILTKLKKCNRYYTTNYDNYLERALELAGREVKVIVEERHLGYMSENQTEVIKFHGDLNNPQKMVLSEKDYEDRLAFESILDSKLTSDVLGKCILFLGYSFRDPNVSYLFRKINDKYGSLPDTFDGKRAYIIVPDPSDFEKRLFHGRNIEVIPIRGSKLTQDTISIINQLLD